MEKEDLIQKLKDNGIHSKAHFYSEAFSRNIGLISPSEQARLSEATVAIPGMGGVGGVHLMTMIRTGVGRFHLADFDTFEVANTNRQFGATVPNIDRPKLEAMTEYAYSVNPYADIKLFPKGVTSENLDDFLEGVDLVLDSLDFFAFDARRQLFNRAREKGIYVITAGPIGLSSAYLIFSPHEGMGFDEYFHITQDMAEQDQFLAFAMGLTPKPTHFKYMDPSRVSLSEKTGPSLAIACQLCCATAGAEGLRILLNKGGIKPVPYYFHFDVYLQKYRKKKLPMGNRHPLQRLKFKIVKRLLTNSNRYQAPPPHEIPKSRFNMDHPSETIIDYIIKAGIQAPSGDNAQPWRFQVHDNTIQVFLDQRADNSFFNYNQYATIISCGAALENMRLAASQLGLKAISETFPDERRKNWIASLTLKAGENNSDPLSNLIWERCTNRKGYEKRPLHPRAMKRVRAVVDDFPGMSLHLITAPEAMKQLGRLVYQVDRIRTEHRPLHEHLNKMIRFTPAEANRTRSGLPLKNLEAGLPGEIFLKITRPWCVMNAMNWLGLGRFVALHALQSVHHSAGCMLLTSKGTSRKDFLTGGQALQRLWLTLTHQGIAMQPMAAAPLFWNRWLAEGGRNFSARHRDMLTTAWESYQALFPDIDFAEAGHIMLLRLGYAKSITHRTLRKEPAEFYNTCN